MNQNLESEHKIIENYKETKTIFNELLKKHSLFKIRILKQSLLNLLKYPLELRLSLINEMLSFLKKYNLHELRSLKNIAELNLKHVKSSIMENPIFKLTGLIVLLFAIFKLAPKLLSESRPFHFAIKQSKTFYGQEFLDLVLEGLIVGIAITIIIYVLHYLPILYNSQLLDSILSIAIREKESTSNSQKDKIDTI